MIIGPRHAISEIRKNYSSLSWWRNRVFVPYVIGTASRYHPRFPGYDKGVHVMDEDWDTLIILDACRADVFQDVADLERFDSYSTRISLGGHSSEWTRRNFQGHEFGDTVYVSANPHTSLIAGDVFHHIVELWETDFDEDAGGVLPGSVSDAAKSTHEKYENKRLIVHFMQPHGPFIGSDIEDHNASERKYWQAYEQNLEYVLPHVYEVIHAISGKTVITADHGQVYASGLKDWLGLGGHKPRLRFPGLVNVPWAIVDGERRKISSGDVTDAKEGEIRDRLKQFGYL